MLTQGNLLIRSDTALGTGTLSLNGGLLAAGGARTIANAVSLGGNTVIGGETTADNLTLSGAVNLGAGSRTIDIFGQGVTTLSNVVSDDGGGRTLTITSLGAGTLILAGSNTFGANGGGLTLNNAALVAGNNNAFGAGVLNISGGRLGAGAAGVSVSNPVTVGGGFNLGSSAGAGLTLSGAVNLGANTLTHDGASEDTLSGSLTGTATGGITVTDGVLNLTGNGSGYTGVSTVTGGILNLQGSADYAGDSAVSGGILNMNSTAAINYGRAGGVNTVTNGTLNMSGPLATYLNDSTVTGGTLNLSAGSYKGRLTLGADGIFNYTGGNFSPAGGADIHAAAGSTLTIAPGRNLDIGGSGHTLTNSGATGVNGTLTGDLTNNAGGVVSGSGTITGALINNGIVNPGNSPGTLTVGTYAPGAGAIQVVEIASAASYDRIVTTSGIPGAAALNGVLSPRLSGNYLPSTNQSFPGIVQATGGGTITGTFASIDNPRVGSSRTLFWQTQYTNTAMDLKAVGNYVPSDLALTPNQLSAGHALNSLTSSATGGDLLTVLDGINALTGNAAVAAAYNEISHAKYAVLPAMTMPVTRLQFQSLHNRLARMRREAEAGKEEVFAGGGLLRNVSLNYDNSSNMLLAAVNLTASDAGTPPVGKNARKRLSIYLEPAANWGALSPTAEIADYRYRNFGFTLGAEYRPAENLLIGVNTGYSKTLADFGSNGGTLNADIIPFNAYGAFFARGFYANAALGYTNSGYDMERHVVFGNVNRTARGRTSGNQFQTGVETGYDAQIGNAVFGPTFSLHYITQTTGGFTETDAGALNLRVDGQSADSLQTGIGLRASYRAAAGGVVVKPQLSVAWQHEFSDNTRSLNAGLTAGGSAMNFQTDGIGRDFALASFDLPAKVSKNLLANVGFTAEIGRDKSTNMGINLGLKYEF